MMTDNESQADSPISCTVEEGEISTRAASPATIVETHSVDTGVQTTSQPQSTESSRPQSPESSRQKNLLFVYMKLPCLFIGDWFKGYYQNLFVLVYPVWIFLLVILIDLLFDFVSSMTMGDCCWVCVSVQRRCLSMEGGDNGW